jgi:hypothetical protein
MRCGREAEPSGKLLCDRGLAVSVKSCVKNKVLCVCAREWGRDSSMEQLAAPCLCWWSRKRTETAELVFVRISEQDQQKTLAGYYQS